MNEALRHEYDRYLEHKDEYLATYRGKYIVLKAGVVLGVYEDVVTAVTTTAKDHEPGTFLVHKVEDDEKIVRYHARQYAA
jgi:hypothetical protein